MSTPTPREDVRTAFKEILEDAELGVPVHDHLPFEGAEARSVVLTIVSGLNRSPGVGLQKDPTTRGLVEQYRLQVDCYFDDKAGAGTLADMVEQTIMDAIDTLRTNNDIHGLRKVADIDSRMAGSGPLVKEARVILDFQFYTHRQLST